MSYNLGSFKCAGTVYEVCPTEYTKKGYPKRGILVEIPTSLGENQKSTVIKFMTLGDDTTMLDNYEASDWVEILFKLDGFFWKKPETGEEIHLQSLKLVDIHKGTNPFDVPSEAMSQDPDDNTPDHLAELTKNVKDYAQEKSPGLFDPQPDDLPFQQLINTQTVMKRKTTGRGFALYSFKDSKGVKCSVQKSSSAMRDCIWLGADDIGLQEFIAFRNPAWQEVELERSLEHHYVANNRMHLTQKQVKALLPILKEFAKTGDL